MIHYMKLVFLNFSDEIFRLLDCAYSFPRPSLFASFYCTLSASFSRSEIDDYAKDGGPGKWDFYAVFYHDPLLT